MAKIFSSGVQQTVVTPNNPTFKAQVVTVPAAGTPVNLPNIPIPDGVDLTIRAKATNGKNLIFVSDSSANAALPAARLTLAAGESVGLAVQNANAVWIDGSLNGVSVEIMVEQ